MKSEYSSLKSATTGKSDLKERMAKFRSESSASENEGLVRGIKKQKNLTNGDAIIQQSTSYHNKLVDYRHDLDLKSEKDPGLIIPSNAPNDLCPSTSMCSFCQSFNISEVRYHVHQFPALNWPYASPFSMKAILFSYFPLFNFLKLFS